MNREPRHALRIAAALLIVVLAAACVPVARPTPAAATPSDSIQGIFWQWTSLSDNTKGVAEAVPNPENYFVVFNADGTLAGQADCNTFTGAYSQENGFTITLGAATTAHCGDASVDQMFLQLLSDTAAGGPDGRGGLALETAGGAQRMDFRNAGPAVQ
jgi:heat shock protein HslJ